MAAVGLKVDAAAMMMSDRPVDSRRLLAGVNEDLRETLDDVRRLVYELRPPALDQLGLVGAVRERAPALDGTGTGLRFIVEGEGGDARLAAAVEVAAYRIATEAMTNVVRHAAATTCRVRICVADRLLVEVRDDGGGLPARWRPGVGTASMRERAVELGGTVSIEATAGGTVVRAEIPLDDVW